MKVNGKNYRTIWVNPENKESIQIIDQKYLPHEFVIEDLRNSDEIAKAIKEMHVRGAGLIGATAGYGMYLASLEAPENNFNSYMKQIGEKLISTRPTAVNLAWAVNKQLKNLKENYTRNEKEIFFETAEQIANEDAENCKKIGKNGVKIIEEISKKKNGETVNILTHCNAGWLAFVDYGSALSPIYNAFEKGIPVHVWVDITGPWNQGAKLTAWELEQQGIPYTIITDNEGGHLMQKGLVDLVIVGADRITKKGDVANKIGTYLKALSAKDNNIPFYVAAPLSTFDLEILNGKDIKIEERGSEEVKYVSGLTEEGIIQKVLITPKESPALNHGFDITPSRLITGLITEKGICQASIDNIINLFSIEKTMEKGYTKFNCKRVESKLQKNITSLNNWRSKLYSLNLIGMYENGVGFGNISIRDETGFIISGTKTGGIENLTEEHYTKVDEWNYDNNDLTCVGQIDASSESLTHGAVYEADSEIKAVIHIHNLGLWNKLINRIPTTSENVEYGTPEMAKEIFRLFKETDVKEKKILVMGGHKEGIISFGKDLDEAGRILLDYFEKYK